MSSRKSGPGRTRVKPTTTKKGEGQGRQPLGLRNTQKAAASKRSFSERRPRITWDSVRSFLAEILGVIEITDKVLIHILLLCWTVISIVAILRMKM